MATLTINAEDIIGADFDRSRASVWVEANTPHGLIVVDGTNVRVGGRRENLVDGVATFNLVTTNSADNPTSFGYRVTITYVPKGSRKQGHDTITTSDFPFTASANLAAIPEAWDNVTIPVSWRSDFRTEMEAIRDQATTIVGLETVDQAVALAQPVVVTHPEGLNRHRAALAGALFARERVVVYGDSITAGAYANDSAASDNAAKLTWAQRGFVGQLRRHLATTYGDAGEGYIGFGGDEGRWTYTGTTSSSPIGPAQGGRQLNPGGKAEATGLGPFDSIDLFGYHGTGTPPPSLFVDSVDQTPSLMTTAQHGLTVGASAWANRGNTTLTATTETSDNVLVATSAAAGNMSFQTPITVGNGLPCVAGDKFIVGADIKSTVSSRAWRVGMFFFDAAGAQLAESSTVDVTASTIGTWQTKSNLITAPTNTAYAAMIVRIDAAGAGAEEHKLRRVRAIPVTAVTGLGGATLWRATRTGLTDATHTLAVAGAATANVFCPGVVISRGTAGVQVSRAGKSGSTTKDHTGGLLSASSAENMLITAIDLMRPTLAIIALGANDVAKQVEQSLTSAAYKANLKTLADRVSAQGGCTLLVGAPRYATDTTPQPQQAFYDAARELAEENTHIAFVDLGGDQWRTYAAANGAGFMFDSIHPTMRGHGDYARVLREAVTSRALGSLT